MNKKIFLLILIVSFVLFILGEWIVLTNLNENFIKQKQFKKSLDSLEREKAILQDSLLNYEEKYTILEQKDIMKFKELEKQNKNFQYLISTYYEKINTVNFLNDSVWFLFFTKQLAREDSLSANDSAEFERLNRWIK